MKFKRERNKKEGIRLACFHSCFYALLVVYLFLQPYSDISKVCNSWRNWNDIQVRIILEILCIWLHTYSKINLVSCNKSLYTLQFCFYNIYSIVLTLYVTIWDISILVGKIAKKQSVWVFFFDNMALQTVVFDPLCPNPDKILAFLILQIWANFLP